jgi:hypothetical protein
MQGVGSSTLRLRRLQLKPPSMPQETQRPQPGRPSHRIKNDFVMELLLQLM